MATMQDNVKRLIALTGELRALDVRLLESVILLEVALAERFTERVRYYVRPGFTVRWMLLEHTKKWGFLVNQQPIENADRELLIKLVQHLPDLFKDTVWGMERKIEKVQDTIDLCGVQRKLILDGG